MCKTIHELEKQIAETKKILASLEEKYDKVKSYTLEEQVADMMHRKTCHWNHTDGCGYYYSDWDNPGDERRKELDKAKKFVAVLIERPPIPIIDYCKRVLDILYL